MRKYLIAALLAGCSINMHAQQTFNELTYTKDVSSFKLNAPSKAKSVKVNIYKEGVGGEVVKTVKMKRTGNDLWTADGTVLWDNREDPARMENHADRLEVHEALLLGRGHAARYSEIGRAHV